MSEINVVTATFGSLRKAMTMPIMFQHDVVQMLKIRGLDLPTYFEVEFCNEGDTTTINVTGSAAEGVQIPESLIQTGRKIKAYIVLTYQDSVQTRYEITIPVYRRPLRNDIDPTDDQQLQIDALVAALNDAINRAEAVEDLLEGGDEDQILRKDSDDDMDFSWSDETKGIFLATYQSTEYAEVAEADTAGKLVLCLYNGRYYLLTKPPVPGDTNYYFTSSANVSNTGVSVYCVYVDYLNGWHATSATVKPTIIPPLMDGEASVGSTDSYARADHVHPSDTSKANAEDVPTKTSDLTNDSGFITAEDVPEEVFWATYGTTTYNEIGAALTAGKLVMCEYSGIYYRYLMRDFNARWFTAPGENVLYWLKVTSGNVWSQGAIYLAGNASPLMDGTAAVGSSGKYAREDHVHPSDTSKITMPDGGSVGQVLKKTANGTEWADESGSGGTTEIFDAIYGATTVSEIETAISNGKLLQCTYDGQQYYLGFTATSLIRSYIFFKSNGSEVTVCSIDADTGVWSHGYRIIPSAYNSNPAMDGTASAGSSTFFSRGDHVHPSDTSKADKVTVTTVSDAGAVSQALDAGKIYEFTGALTSLTITMNVATAPAQYHFRFDSGSTAPTLTLPNTVTMPSGFQVEANKHYEIDILDGYGVAQSW